jgi:uncharacterized phage protein gp47/JayE
MASFLTKDRDTILRHALEKLVATTPLTSVAPGSIVRSLVEVITTELGDLYAILDFNSSMSFVSTAQGRALDLLGSLYDVQRKTLTEIATIDQSLGAFYFYVDSPAFADIVIPAGVQIRTDTDNTLGDQFVYTSTDIVRIPAGRTRAFASIRPAFTDSVFTAGMNTLVKHSFPSPVGTAVKCTNPKPIQAQVGFENDDAYRARLVKAVRTAAGGTNEALRFALLGLPGIRDVRVRDAVFGLGSFEVVVVPENNALTDAVLVGAALTLQRLRPVGVQMSLKTPDLKPIEIDASVVVRNVGGVNKADIAKRVEIGIVRYINTLLAGDTLIYNQLIQAMLDSADVVTDVVVTGFRINAVEQLRRNVGAEPDEQIIPGAMNIGYQTS